MLEVRSGWKPGNSSRHHPAHPGMRADERAVASSFKSHVLRRMTQCPDGSWTWAGGNGKALWKRCPLEQDYLTGVSLRSRVHHHQETSSFCLFFIFTMALRIELGALCMTGEHSTTELHSQSLFL